MKIYLPSNGLLSLTSIIMRNPIISDIRKLSELSESDTLKKTEFLHLLADKDEINSITPSDRDYLFFIAASAFSLNHFQYKVSCACGKVNQSTLFAGAVSPIRLPYKQKSTITKTVGSVEYTFHRVSVQAESDAIFFAMDGPDEQFEEIFADAIVAYTLFKSITPDNIQRVRNIDIAVYYFAYFYQQFLPHGLDLRTNLICTSCQNPITVLHPVRASLINTDIRSMMNAFVALGERLSLEDFYEMTLPEYNLYVATLNNKLRANG